MSVRAQEAVSEVEAVSEASVRVHEAVSEVSVRAQEAVSEMPVRVWEAVSEVSVRSMHFCKSEMFRRGQIPSLLGKINQGLITALFQGNHQPILNDHRNVSVLLRR